MIKAAVVGATGYSGQELVDLLLKHPEVDLRFLTARFDKEVNYADIYPRFSGRTGLPCVGLDVDKISSGCDVVFLALPHTVSMDVAPGFLEKGVKVIDLSADYRISPDQYLEWYKKEHADPDNLGHAVYGLPELYPEEIKNAVLVANPGCYPTGVILGLLPLIKTVRQFGVQVFVDSKSGTSGAGRKGSIPLSFSEVDEDFRCYKPNEHQHIPEMEKVLSSEAGGGVQVNFSPHLIPVRRGILSTMYIPGKDFPEEDELRENFFSCYSGARFVRIRKSTEMPSLRDVTGTNYCDIGIRKTRGVVTVVSVIDNLLKGASGQAVQNMNIMFGFDEAAGLV